MLLEQARVLLVVHAQAALARELLRQLAREAVRRLERERAGGRDLTARSRLLEHLHAALERLAETLLLGGQHLPDLIPVPLQLRVRTCHLLDDRVGETGDE